MVERDPYPGVRRVAQRVGQTLLDHPVGAPVGVRVQRGRLARLARASTSQAGGPGAVDQAVDLRQARPRATVVVLLVQHRQQPGAARRAPRGSPARSTASDRRAASGSRSSTDWPASAWTAIRVTACETTSCSSRAIRRRSASTAAVGLVAPGPRSRRVSAAMSCCRRRIASPSPNGQPDEEEQRSAGCSRPSPTGRWRCVTDERHRQDRGAEQCLASGRVAPDRVGRRPGSAKGRRPRPVTRSPATPPSWRP